VEKKVNPLLGMIKQGLNKQIEKQAEMLKKGKKAEIH
jgi:hypothetical protein